MDEHRPDPDALLETVTKDEARQQRGQLKIFLGMAAGVGKTYAMLTVARQLRSEGVDVVVGYVETHQRAEVELLLSGFEIIPRQMVAYRGSVLEEMDLNAILARRPQLVLVDELAHTNAPGLRHIKRWQDVLELLEAGMDVYTTVNVQHFESRVDAVRQITGIIVHETVPDSLLDEADEIKLVDLSPEDLRKRLAEGKVYTSERIEVATNNFFRIGNLTALREMALRLTAEHVDHQLRDYMRIKHIAGPWKSGERLMVAVGPSPFSERLIRWTRRMAYNLEAPWLAVYVETSQPLSPAAKETLARNLALASSLGSQVIMAAGEDIANVLLRLARQHNVTQIVAGKPLRYSSWNSWRGGSLVDKLIRSSGDIDIYVVTGDESSSERLTRQPSTLVTHSSWQGYLWAWVIITLVTAGDYLLTTVLSWIGYQAVGLTELLAVLLIAVYIGRGPALLAALLSAISWNFLFIEPRFTFGISQIQDVILFLMYFFIAIFAGSLTARLRAQERLAQSNAERTMALYTLAHETASAVDMDTVLHTAITQIGRVFAAKVAILLSETGKLASHCHPASTLQLDEKEYGVALWSFENRKRAGRFTDTLPLASALYLPLLTPRWTVGVIGVQTQQPERLSFEQEALLETFVNQVALVIERELLDEAAEQAAMLRESERLYTTLLNSISHELRTPITAIAGAASGLMDVHTAANLKAREELTKNIQAAAARLNRLVENLLDMSRLESGRLRLKREWCDVQEIIGVVVQRLGDDLAQRPLSIQIPPVLPLIRVDFALIEQVLVNLLDNAHKYTPDGLPITISACQNGEWLEVAVSDKGRGIPVADVERVFEKFYRVPGVTTGGTGLGLSVSRGLAEAHGGSLTVENEPQGGARFTLRLPLEGPPPPAREAGL